MSSIWRTGPSDDARRAVAPVAIAQDALVELAGRQAGQLGLEIDRARHLLAREVGAAIGDQFVCQRLARLIARHGLDHGLHLLAEIGVGHAEHRGIGDLGMRDQQVLALLRVDVHAAGDDHERRAVGEMEIAVLIEVADVADGAHAAVRRAGLLRLLRIVEVLERGAGLEPDGAGRAARTLLEVGIEDVQLAEQHAADGAGMGQPFLAVAGGEAQSLGRAVVLVNDGPPPRDHVALHLQGTGRGRMDRDFERRKVIARAHRLGQLQHAREHGRHELAVGDAVDLDEFEIPLGVEVLHDDGGAAHADRQVDGGLGRRVVERGGRQVDHALAVLPELDQEIEQRKVLHRRLLGERPQDALGTPRRARGVEHRSAEDLVRDWRFRAILDRLMEADDTLALARAVHHHADGDVRARLQGLARHVEFRLRGEEDLRHAVVDDVGEFARRQERIHAREVDPRPLARGAGLEVAAVVLHEDGDVIEPLQAGAAQEVREAVGPRLEFGIRDRFAGIAHDEGRLQRSQPGMEPRIHALSSRGSDARSRRCFSLLRGMVAKSFRIANAGRISGGRAFPGLNRRLDDVI